VKRTQLLKRVTREARAKGLSVEVIQGRRHEKWVIGSIGVTVPRHRDINEMTAESIQKQLEDVLGRGWWQ
jgi:hypothetical protein